VLINIKPLKQNQMKKIYTLVAGVAFFIGSSVKSNAQDTLLYEGFQFVMDTYLQSITSSPPGNTTDAMWYNYDRDQLPDGSGGNRNDDWFQILPFSDADLYLPNGIDSNVVMTSNSWFSSVATADNWLITENVQLEANDTLYFRCAPRQTPRYLDGFEVLISTTTNEDVSFDNINGGAKLFTAAEMVPPLGSDTTFSTFTFDPSGAFVHGQDGTFIDFAGAVTSPAHRGQLRTFAIPLTAYAGQNIFLAFHHNATDDNLISIDDILVRGNNIAVGINQVQSNEFGMNLFPNPASDLVQLNYNLKNSSEVAITIYDITGKVVYTENKSSMTAGRNFSMINTAKFAKGYYSVALQTNEGRGVSKLIVK
jgi:Secretion system C-terminal sorting domain/Cleaved Adhesin Domain